MRWLLRVLAAMIASVTVGLVAAVGSMALQDRLLDFPAEPAPTPLTWEQCEALGIDCR